MDRTQMILLGFATLVVGYQAIKGWRLGLVRQIVRFGALAAAYVAGYFWSSITVPFLRPLGYPDFILHAIGGAGLGLLAFLLICFVGGVLFKRTAHQDMGVVWFFYGATGALMGVVFGLLVVLFFADAIRLLGGIAEAQARFATVSAKQENTAAAATKKSTTAKKRNLDSPVPALLIEAKESLDKSLPGEILQTIDPIPKKTYAIADKMGRVLADPEAAVRFLSFPGARELAEQPEILALRDDPKILKTLQSGHYMQLLKNEKIVKVANDPKIAAMIQKFDLEKALDQAVKSH